MHEAQMFCTYMCDIRNAMPIMSCNVQRRRCVQCLSDSSSPDAQSHGPVGSVRVSLTIRQKSDSKKGSFYYRRHKHVLPETLYTVCEKSTCIGYSIASSSICQVLTVCVSPSINLVFSNQQPFGDSETSIGFPQRPNLYSQVHTALANSGGQKIVVQSHKQSMG